MVLFVLSFKNFHRVLMEFSNYLRGRKMKTTLFPNPLYVPKQINGSQNNKGKGNYELNWNERSHQSMAHLGRFATVNKQLGDVISIHGQSYMAYTVTTQPLEGLHNNSHLLDGIYSDNPSQVDHTQSCPSYKQVTNQV